MSYFITSLAINAIFSAVCFIFVVLGNPNSRLSRSFCYFSFTITTWAAFYLLWGISSNSNDALLFTRCLNNVALFIPVTFLHFAIHLINSYSRFSSLIRSFYVVNILFILVFGFTPLYIETVGKVLIFNYWPLAGPYFPYMLFEYCLLTGLAFILLFKRLRLTSGIPHQQIKLVFFGVLIAYLGGATNYPLFYKISFFPYGNSLVVLYTIAVAYAIFKYHLLDMKLAFKRSLVYWGLISSITLLCFLSIYFTEHILKGIIGYQSFLISMIMATTIALFFTPLRNILQGLVEKRLFSGDYIQITEQNELLRKEIVDSERMKAVSVLASGLAHEIKNPLTVLTTFAEHVPSKKDDKEFIKQFEQIVPKELNRINNLINELLTFSKPSPLQLEDLNLKNTVYNLIQMLTPKLASKNISIVTELDVDNLIKADPNQLKQALLNLMLNSIDAMPHGGTLSIKIQMDNNKYLVEISDSGHGIDAKDIKHIFEPFYSKKQGGTGLGLAITKDIIEKHGGKISVKNSSDKGTTFWVLL
jgi:signal transduction histidine kinase